MNNKKYRIIIDTNIIRLDKKNKNFSEIINFNILDSIKDFLSRSKIEGNVEICIPEMVLKERMCQVLEEIERSKKSVEAELEFLKGFGLTPNESYKLFNYGEKVSQKLESLIKKDLFKKIDTPNIESEVLIERVYQRKPPFYKEDKGFKDTVIWLSILEDAKRNPDRNYIFFTNDKGFKNDKLNTEFGECSIKKFNVLSELIDLKKQFDLEYDLKLQLEEISQKIKATIGKWTFNEIEKKLNKEKSNYFIRDLYSNKRFFIEEFFISQSSLEFYNVENIESIDTKNYKVVLTIPAMAKLGSLENVYTTSPLGTYYTSTSTPWATNSWATTSSLTATFSPDVSDSSSSLYINPNYSSYTSSSPIPLPYNTGSLINIFLQAELKVPKDLNLKKIIIEKVTPSDPVES